MLGRFLQPDPSGTSGGVNLYAYVGNDLLNLTDPQGLAAEATARHSHDILFAASFCPSICGSAFSAGDGALYALQGDKVNAGISFGAAAVGIVSDAAAARLAAKGVQAGIDVTKSAEDAIRLHHAWPKYLGGAAKQDLVPLTKSMHDAFHSGLDKILPRQWGAKYYEGLSPAARQQVLQDLGNYTKAFDAKYGTNLYDAMLRNGFPGQ